MSRPAGAQPPPVLKTRQTRQPAAVTYDQQGAMVWTCAQPLLLVPLDRRASAVPHKMHMPHDKRIWGRVLRSCLRPAPRYVVQSNAVVFASDMSQCKQILCLNSFFLLKHSLISQHNEWGATAYLVTIMSGGVCHGFVSVNFPLLSS